MKVKKIKIAQKFLMILVIGLTSPIFSESVSVKWTEQFGTSEHDYAIDIAIGLDGSIYTAGYTQGDIDGLGPDTNKGATDVYIVKHDANGNLLWTKQFGTAYSEYTWSLSIGLDGFIYVTGGTNGDLDGSGPNTNNGYFDAFISKHDTNGNLLWINQFGTAFNDESRSLSIGPDGFIYTTGYTYGDIDGSGPDTNQGYGDVYISKHDTNGNLLWTDQFGSIDMESAMSIAIGLDGSIYTSGYTYRDIDGFVGPDTNQGYSDVYISKHDTNGNLLWTDQFGSIDNESAMSIAIGLDGSIYTSGYTYGDIDGSGPETNEGYIDAYISKHDANGNHLWIDQFGSTVYEYAQDKANSITIGPDGAIYTAGGTANDAFFTKYDVNGNHLWTEEFGSTAYDEAMSIAIGPDGAIYILGYTNGDMDGSGTDFNHGGYDEFITKFTPPLPPGPDLTFNSSIATERSRTIRNRTVYNLKLFGTIENVGNVEAGNFKTKFYLSHDLSHSLDDIEIYSLSIDSIPAGGSFDYIIKHAQIARFSFKGMYVICVIDSENSIAESNETNNKITVLIE